MKFPSPLDKIFARPVANSSVVTPNFELVGTVYWSEEWSGWQFAAIPVVMPWAYQDVLVRLRYNYNVNWAESMMTQ